jgi:hypothetical protein
MNNQHRGSFRSQAAGQQYDCALNELGRNELSNMPKNKTVTGPMRMQPAERASMMPTQVLPRMPTVDNRAAPASQPKQNPTRTEAVRVAKARITLRNSLRKQREALKAELETGD